MEWLQIPDGAFSTIKEVNPINRVAMLGTKPRLRISTYTRKRNKIIAKRKIMKERSEEKTYAWNSKRELFHIQAVA